MKKLYRKMRDSRKTKDFLVFLVFVGIAAVFWYILALNDEVQDTFEVPVKVVDVPDSVTFITNPPASIHVTIRERGLDMLRHRVSGLPTLELTFREYAEGDVLRVKHTRLQAALRRIFGAAATFSAVSPDSLVLPYTTQPGHRLPLELDFDVTVAPGMVLGTPRISESFASVYSNSKSDTLRKLYTEKVVLRDLDKTTSMKVPLLQIPGKRVEPAEVEVTFVVEQLVKKESEVMVEADNIPLGHDILFFPSKVRVSYFVPMSRYTEKEVPIRVQASFNEAFNASSDKVGIKVVEKAPYISNVELKQDSVEYAVVKTN